MKCEGICECKIYEEPVREVPIEGLWLDVTILLGGVALFILLSAIVGRYVVGK